MENIEIIQKLFQSFDELERCISVTQDVLATKDGVPEEVSNRISQYPSIVEKQRELAKGLESHIASENWLEVNRIVRVINGLSSMIRDDAREILAGALSLNTKEVLGAMVC
jgi:hypothetical protein